MPDDVRSTILDLLDRLVQLLRRVPWPTILVDGVRLLRQWWASRAPEGMYEVLEYDSTLELLDRQGVRALFRKRERVQYLQNRIIAYLDQAWGDGQILIHYRCSPGVVVDRYRPGNKTFLLISLRETKQRGDIDEFHIEWESRRSFMRPRELWETEVSHLMRMLRVHIVFPPSRPPLRVWLTEHVHQQTEELGQDARQQLPDGRWRVVWETDRPRQGERYSLEWEW